MKREKHFESEAQLCAAFAAWAPREGWTVYAETAGWDMLLVAKDGRQLGIEAKLDLNLKVIAQALKSSTWSERDGPDHRAVLVPAMKDGIDDILAFVGVGIFIPHQTYARGAVDPVWSFRQVGSYHFDERMLYDWNPLRRCPLPDYVPDVPAGVPGPSTLSPWKVGALRVLALLEIQGFVTRDDVRNCGNDPRRWCASDGWLKQLGSGRWGPGRAPRFDEQHPTIYAKVLAETREAVNKRAVA